MNVIYKYSENGFDVVRHDSNNKDNEKELTNFIIRLSSKGIINLKKLNDLITEKTTDIIINSSDKIIEKVIK